MASLERRFEIFVAADLPLPQAVRQVTQGADRGLEADQPAPGHALDIVEQTDCSDRIRNFSPILLFLAAQSLLQEAEREAQLESFPEGELPPENDLVKISSIDTNVSTQIRLNSPASLP